MMSISKYTQLRSCRDVVLYQIIAQLKQIKIITDQDVVLSGESHVDAKELLPILDRKMSFLLRRLGSHVGDDEAEKLKSAIVILSYSLVTIGVAFDIS